MENTVINGLEEMVGVVEKSDQSVVELTQALTGNYLRQAKLVRELVQHGDVVEGNTLQEIARTVGIDEIHITDPQGILRHGSAPGFFGFDFNSTEQTKPFMKALTNKNFELAQKPQTRGVDGKLFQYVGVARQDQPGLIQIGMEPKELSNLLKRVDLQNVIADIRFGEGGRALVVNGEGTVVAHWDKDMVGQDVSGSDWFAQISGKDGMFTSTMDSVQHMIGYEKHADKLFVVTLPYTGYFKPFEALRNKLLIVIIISLVASVGIIIWSVGTFVNRPIREAATFALKIRDGQLDETITPAYNDEVGSLAETLAQMAHTLKENMEEISMKTRDAEEKAAAAEVATAEAEKARLKAEQSRREGMLQAASQLESIVQQVTAASHELSSHISESKQGSDTQKLRAEENTVAMEEMNATVLSVAKNASDSASGAEQARKQAETGGQIVRRVVESINSLRAEADKLGSEMGQLGSQAEAIGEVMTVITDIADQTNLLALNAAIEAARAGEAGRGFAVVADEVRKLAEKTMQATKEVGTVIGSIQNSAKTSIDSMTQTARMVEDTTGLASEAGEALDEIISLVDTTADQVRAIATAAEEQSAASEQINVSMDQINRIAAETADSMDVSLQAMNELARLSGELESLINELKSA